MIAHQLDLFGGPLKPPKKIKVDDYDSNIDEPKPNEPEAAPASEPEIIGGPEALAEQTGAVDNIVSNDAEWVPAHDEEIDGDEAAEMHGLIEQPATEPAFGEVAPEEMNNVDDEPEIYTDEAIFSGEIVTEPDTNSAVEEDEIAPAIAAEIISADNATEEPARGTDGTTDEEPEDDLPVLVTDHENIEESREEETTTNDAQVGNKPKKHSDESDDGLNIPADEELFKRQYYSMRETSAMFGVNQSLLRFWENEFDILQPKKNKKGDRYFRPVDIKNLVLIYNLLRVRKFTLDGAKDYLASNKKAADTFELVRRLDKLKAFLLELKAGL